VSAYRFSWYWPFARPEELDWARATPRPGERVVVQVIDRDGAPAEGEEAAIEVVRNLPDVERRAMPRAAWLASRARTYRARSVARRRLWETGAFDLYHLHYLNRFTDSWASLPRPLVMSVHDVVPHVSRLGSAGERALAHRLYHRADALVVHHRTLADQLVSDFGVPASKVHIIPHQVFPVGDDDPTPPAGPPTVLFFGSFRPNKGLEVLAEAISRIPDRDLRFVIAGHGDARLERMVTQLAADDVRVTAEIGFATLERKRALFRQASVCVLPYTSFASMSGVLHDAYGHGRPVVVTDVGALGDAVREDGTGEIVTAGSAAELAAATTRALRGDASADYSVAALAVAKNRSPVMLGPHLRSEVYEPLLQH